MLISSSRNKELPDPILNYIVNNHIVVGCWAVVLNGYSYPCFEAPVSVLTKNKFLEGYQDVNIICKYIPDYDTEVGISGGIPNESRTICDFLMYPKELSSDLYMPDIIEGYNEEYNGDFSKVYDMMDILGIDRGKLDYWLDHLDDYSDE